MNAQFEFRSNRLTQFMEKINKESRFLINKIVELYSPIQKDEDVEVIRYLGDPQILRVIEITLFAVSLYGSPGDKLSFLYKGIPLTKKGGPMKNRKPIMFDTFLKNNKKYHMPSYFKVEIKPARMYR